MLARLQVGNAHHARRGETGAEDELFFFQTAILQGDFANFKFHAARRQVAHQRGKFLIVAGLRAFHEKVDALGMRNGNELRLGIDVEVIAHVAQSLGRLGDAGVKMIDNLVLGAGGQRDKDKGDGGGEFEQGFHVTLLCVARGKSGNATPFYREY